MLTLNPNVYSASDIENGLLLVAQSSLSVSSELSNISIPLCDIQYQLIIFQLFLNMQMFNSKYLKINLKKKQFNKNSFKRKYFIFVQFKHFYIWMKIIVYNQSIDNIYQMQMQIRPKIILDTINKIRENPNLAVNQIKDQLKKFQSNNVYRNKKDIKVRTLSGKAGWQDTVLALERQKAKGPLTWNSLLERATEQYKQLAIQGNEASPFEVIKSFCSYEGNISFNINESDVEQDLIELVSVMIVGDGDEKKGSRTAIFHPLYRQFACSIRKSGNKNILYTAFAESIQQKSQKSQEQSHEKFPSFNTDQSRKTGGWAQVNQKSQNTPSKYKNNERQHESKEDYLRKGKELIGLLNKVRKQPKQYVHVLKAQIDKFKDQKTLVTEYGTINTKEGQIPYYDLISQLQSQYALPTIRQVTGLSLVALEQVIESESMIEYKASVQGLIDKFCLSSEGVRSLKVRDINGMPTQALLIRLLLGDGDRKRTARRKMLSPICKAIGCCVGKNIVVVNVGETAKDNHQFVEEYMQNISEDHPRSPNKKWQKPQQKQSFYPNSFQVQEKRNDRNMGNRGQRVVVKKTSRSYYEKREGRSYKITEINLIFDDGKCQQIVEEDLIH